MTPTDQGGDAPLTRARLRAMRATQHALKVPPVPRDFRADIEGMRAVAVVGVMLWHAGVPILPGGFVGVDVFFVVSGFLMTALLLEEARTRGRIDLGRFYARRARRLLPAALSALLGTALLTLAFVPRTRWGEIGGDLVSAAAYVVNWRMAQRSVDYLDQDGMSSPVQHFWSLAVEEQFYLLWPVLLLVTLLMARGRAKVFRCWSWGITLALLVSSLVLSAWWTAVSAAEAYFVTPTRIHELMLGALVALGARAWPCLPPWLAALGGWAGLAMIVLAIVVIDSQTPFPATTTLLPTVGTALVLVSGSIAGRLGPAMVLRARTLQWIGRTSYSLYLWHWPFVAVAASLARVGHGGPDRLPVPWGVLAVLVSVVPAWLSFRYVEEPFRVRGRVLTRSLRQPVVTQRTLLLGINCTMAGILSGLLMISVAPSTGTGAVAWHTPGLVADLRAPVGADTLASGAVGPAVIARADLGIVLGLIAPDQAKGTVAGDGVRTAGSSLSQDVERVPEVPQRLGMLAVPLEQVRHDVPNAVPEGCVADLKASRIGVCTAGDPDGEVTVLLQGDSHAGMWITALDRIGQERGWRILALTKSSCPPVQDLTVPRAGQPGGDEQCRDYQDKIPGHIAEIGPDVVLLSSAAYGVDPDRLARAMALRVDTLEEEGILVGMVRDVPRPSFDVPDCLVSHRDDVPECAFPRDVALDAAGTGQEELAVLRPGLPVVDLNAAICPGPVCSPVVGAVVVWRDSNHLSATYVESLTPALEAQVVPLVEAATSPAKMRSSLWHGLLLGQS